MTNPGNFGRSFAWTIFCEWVLRLALGLTLLSAVADRFGLWGAPGTSNVSWGDWVHFVQYCGRVNSFLPASWALPLAWIATSLEVVLGIGLIVGARLRVTAYLSAILFASFALAMTISLGVKSPLNFSVFADAGGALYLASVVESRNQSRLTVDERRMDLT